MFVCGGLNNKRNKISELIQNQNLLRLRLSQKEKKQRDQEEDYFRDFGNSRVHHNLCPGASCHHAGCFQSQSGTGHGV